MPETWAMYGVDANGDGVADPNNPEDAIYAAARYLSAAGMPADVWGAIFAYNHADWYVEEVLANAGCYADEVGGSYTTLTLVAADPGLQVHPGRRLEEADPGGLPEPPSRPPPAATNSASAASGRWRRSPASSRTSAAG